MYGHAKNPMMKTSRATRSVLPDKPKAEPGMTPTSAIAKTSSGKARKMSISRAITASIQPPKYPAITPMIAPMTTASAVAANPISSEYRAPTTIRASMSRPVVGSTPNGWFRLIPPNGPVGRLKVGSMSSEWYVFGFATRYGPKIAIRMRMTMTMPPAIATLSLRSRLHAIWLRDRPSMALSDADNASSGAGPPGPDATSIGTAIVKPTCDPD